MDEPSRIRWEQNHLEEGFSWHDQYRAEQAENAQLRNRVVELEQLCRDMYREEVSDYPDNVKAKWVERMEELGVGR